MPSPLIFIVIGFIGWWATGVDDTLSLGLLIKGRRPEVRQAILRGYMSGVLLILAVASVALIDTIQIAPGLLEARLFGLPLQNLVGIVPILIGVRALYPMLRGHHGTIAYPPVSKLRATGMAWMLGLQVYVINSADDFALHIGILGGVVKAPITFDATVSLIAYWIGSLIGEATSLWAANTLAEHFRTRQALEGAAALVVIGVGILIIAGVF